MDPSVSEHVRKGVMYNEADIVIFEPEVSTCESHVTRN